jgi:hypothetical protein
MSKTAAPTTTITRDDLETKLRSFQSGIQGKVDDQKSTLVTIGAVAGVILLLIVFVLGKRSGKKKTTFVEIRRI